MVLEVGVVPRGGGGTQGGVEAGLVHEGGMVPEGGGGPKVEVIPEVEVVPEVGEVTKTQTSQDERKPEPPHDLATMRLVKNKICLFTENSSTPRGQIFIESRLHSLYKEIAKISWLITGFS